AAQAALPGAPAAWPERPRRALGILAADRPASRGPGGGHHLHQGRRSPAELAGRHRPPDRDRRGADGQADLTQGNLLPLASACATVIVDKITRIDLSRRRSLRRHFAPRWVEASSRN